jgi:hypothetical protein
MHLQNTMWLLQSFLDNFNPHAHLTNKVHIYYKHLLPTYLLQFYLLNPFNLQDLKPLIISLFS